MDQKVIYNDVAESKSTLLLRSSFSYDSPPDTSPTPLTLRLSVRIHHNGTQTQQFNPPRTAPTRRPPSAPGAAVVQEQPTRSLGVPTHAAGRRHRVSRPQHLQPDVFAPLNQDVGALRRPRRDPDTHDLRVRDLSDRLVVLVLVLYILARRTE